MGVLGAVVIGGLWIVLFDTFGQIVRGTYIESACRIPENIYPVWTSS